MQQLINVTVAVLLIVGHFVIVAVAESAKSSRSLTLIAPSISFAYHQTSPSSLTTHNRRHVHSIQTHCIHHQTLLQSSSINYQSKLQMNQSKHGYHRRETAKTSNLESNGGGGDYVLDLGASFGKSTKSSVADFTSKEFSSDEITIELNDTKMSNKHNQQTDEPEDDNEDDNSEANNPRRGRPGIVVFSGGTAFNSAAAEMASRIISVGVGSGFEGDTNGEGEISRMNSLNSLVDLMTLGRMDGMGTDKAGGVQTTTSAITDSNLGTHNQGVAIAGGTKVWHVLPVTDDGGSTAEIVRVLGGPAVGDIRSRLLRLAPGTTGEARAVRRLLGHRLVSMDSWKEKNVGDAFAEMISRLAREEWLDILDGGQESHQRPKQNLREEDSDDDTNNLETTRDYEHPLWKGVSAPYRSIIRAFLVHFHTQVLQTHNGMRHSQSNPPFDFTGGSVGNFFFAGARTFFGSLPAAIFLFSKVAGMPSGSRVIPSVLTEERLVLGAVLKDGTRIRGQYNISHPHPKLPRRNRVRSKSDASHKQQSSAQRDRSGSASNLGHRAVVKSAIDSQEAISSLHPSPMARVTYLLHDPTWHRRSRPVSKTISGSKQQANQIASKTANSTNLEWSDRHEIHPEPNPLVLDAIANSNCIVFGCGSLYTSVLPSLVLEGVGEAIAQLDCGATPVPKVLLLNGWHDRETSWSELSDDGELVVKRMDATAFVEAVVDALDMGGVQSGWYDNSDLGDEECNDSSNPLPLVTDYITHILYPIGTEIEINERSLCDFCSARLTQSQRTEGKDNQRTPSKSNRSTQVKQIKVIGVASIPANKCSEGSRSGGQSYQRVFDPRSLVDTLLDLANGGSGE